MTSLGVVRRACPASVPFEPEPFCDAAALLGAGADEFCRSVLYTRFAERCVLVMAALVMAAAERIDAADTDGDPVEGDGLLIAAIRPATAPIGIPTIAPAMAAA